MKKFEELKEILNSVESDAKKFYENNNSAAGTRLRKSMLELKNIAQEIRKEVSDKKLENKKEKV